MTDHNIGGARIPRPAGAAAASACIDAENHGVCDRCGAERQWPRIEPRYQWRDLDDAMWTQTWRGR